jgi:hypothetical protein
VSAKTVSYQTKLADVALSVDERAVQITLLDAVSWAPHDDMATRAVAAIEAFERIVLGMGARDPRDWPQIALEMYEHIVFMHGYMLGLMMGAGKSVGEALDEMEPMRTNTRRLAHMADFPISDYMKEPSE